LSGISWRDEIGVRKVLGASIADILVLLGREFMALAGLSILMAWPVAYLTMAQWLQGFAYRIEMDAGPFLIGGITALGIALLTLSYHTIKAARMNPVRALRYE
jgi:putative ABC transport system permease protein